MKFYSKEKEYNKIEGRATFYFLLANALSFIAGGVIAKTSMRMTFFINVPFLLAAFFISFGLREIRGKREWRRVRWRDEARGVKNERFMLWLFFRALVFTFFPAIFWFYQPYLIKSGFKVSYLGIIFAFFSIIKGYHRDMHINWRIFLGQGGVWI